MTLESDAMSPRILVVDDDADNLILIELALKRYGFEVIKAQGGPAALDFLAHDLPDLMILDIMMPEMDGYEVCQQVKADPRTAHLPVVILTARTPGASEAEAFQAGANDCIPKPISIVKLVARLRAILDQSANS